MKIYQISGLGANQNAFKYLKIHKDFELIYLPWLIPERRENLAHYTERMIEKIDFNEDFVLMGLSFGGIIVNEMNQLVHPKKNILISTVKARNELPKFMKFSSLTHLHELIPGSFLNSDKTFSYAMFRKLYHSKLPDLNDFFEYRDAYYLKWSINQIVNWKNDENLQNYVHIHGDKDVVFPFSLIKNAAKIEGGTHIMVMQKAKKVSEIINQELSEL